MAANGRVNPPNIGCRIQPGLSDRRRSLRSEQRFPIRKTVMAIVEKMKIEIVSIFQGLCISRSIRFNRPKADG
jgi:hypothetical protein